MAGTFNAISFTTMHIIERNKWFYRIFPEIEAKNVKLCQVSYGENMDVMERLWNIQRIEYGKEQCTRTRANSYGICTKSKKVPTKNRCCNGNGWRAIIKVRKSESQSHLCQFTEIIAILYKFVLVTVLCTSLKIFVYRTLNIGTWYLEQRMLRFHWVAYCCSVLI